MPTGDTRCQLHKINVPTLILVGELDFTDYHQIADFYKQQISDSRKVIIPNVAHFMNLEKSSFINKEVIQFLRKE